MPLVEINAASVYRLVLTELVAAMPTTRVRMAHEDDADGAFVRLHAVVEGPRRSRPDDVDTRTVVVRATAQVPASDLRASGYALHDLAHGVKAALSGKRITGEGHTVHLDAGTVEIGPTADDSLPMRDAQITWTAAVTRISGSG